MTSISSSISQLQLIYILSIKIPINENIAEENGILSTKQDIIIYIYNKNSNNENSKNYFFSFLDLNLLNVQ